MFEQKIKRMTLTELKLLHIHYLSVLMSGGITEKSYEYYEKNIVQEMNRKINLLNNRRTYG